MKPCPCGSAHFYLNCCGKFISGEQFATTPEELMRSRYTAYTIADMDYIVRTMRGKASIDFDKEDATQFAKQVEWSGLSIIRTAMADPLHGIVEFTAYYIQNDEEYELHEISQFEKLSGQWFYVDGTTPSSQQKIGRNEPCFCGSQKKYKKCCGKNS